jgi:hypothetical protein
VVTEDEPNHLAEKTDEVIKALIPPMTEETTEIVAKFLDVDVFAFKNPNISAILRFFHSLRYAAASHN